MYYTADSIVADKNNVEMAENNTKGFDTPNYGGEFYDMDATDISYQELFNSAQDQAVPDFMTLNTPPVLQTSQGYTHPLNSYLPTTASLSSDTYLPVESGAYYSSASSTYSSSPVPVQQHNVPAIPEHIFSSRGPIIVPSATAPEQPKPRRKGGRKPKNDPLPPHLEERRRLRRIRNKEAAQKCRERRLAQTEELLSEIDALERQTRQVEEAINQMREYKDQCEFVLNSHMHTCNRIGTKRRIVPNLTLNTFSNTTCATAHRRSSSSDDHISPTYIL